MFEPKKPDDTLALQVAIDGNQPRYRILHALRGLGLECCDRCKIWKDEAHFAASLAGWECPFDPLLCTSCATGAGAVASGGTGGAA